MSDMTKALYTVLRLAEDRRINNILTRRSNKTDNKRDNECIRLVTELRDAMTSLEKLKLLWKD